MEELQPQDLEDLLQELEEGAPTHRGAGELRAPLEALEGSGKEANVPPIWA